MRIKFNKGFTPEAVADIFLDYVEKRDLVIGAVNIYIQEYDENMKPIRDNENSEYIEITPTDAIRERYSEYSADLRRSKLKAI